MFYLTYLLLPVLAHDFFTFSLYSVYLTVIYQFFLALIMNAWSQFELTCGYQGECRKVADIQIPLRPRNQIVVLMATSAYIKSSDTTE